MNIHWLTGSIRFVWVNGNVDSSGLWEGLAMWSDRCGITYRAAATLDEAQIVVVEPDEYSAVFGVSGFVGHSTLITDDITGLGKISYITLRDDTGPAWQRDAAWAHEAGHAEGEIDRPSSRDTIYSYADIQNEPSAADAARWIERFGPSDASGRFALENGAAGRGDDTVWGTEAQNVIYGNQGADILNGLAGDDTLYGGQDNDTVSGGEGADALYGNLGDDLLVGGIGNDLLFGGMGADTLSGGAGSDLLVGGLGRDVIYAGGDDTVVGYDADEDTLVLTDGTLPHFSDRLTDLDWLFL